MNEQELQQQLLDTPLNKLEIKAWALNKDLGVLNFENVRSFLEKIRDTFIELEELDYKNNLTPNEANKINGLIITFKREHLKKIKGFSVTNPSGVPKEIHDQIERDILNFYNTSSEQVRPFLTYLRQERDLKSTEAKDLQKEKKEILQAKKEYEKMMEEAKTKMNNLELELIHLQKEKQKIESAHGQIATKQLAKYFSDQAEEHKDNADEWLLQRGGFYRSILYIISANVIIFFMFWIPEKVGATSIMVKDIFTIEYGIIKLAILSIFSYGLLFASKNYRIESNLKTVNMHRRNVAQTLEDFLTTEPGPGTKSEILKKATDAMFRHLPIGYISKEDGKDSSPVFEIINRIVKP